MLGKKIQARRLSLVTCLLTTHLYFKSLHTGFLVYNWGKASTSPGGGGGARGAGREGLRPAHCFPGSDCLSARCQLQPNRKPGVDNRTYHQRRLERCYLRSVSNKFQERRGLKDYSVLISKVTLPLIFCASKTLGKTGACLQGQTCRICETSLRTTVCHIKQRRHLPKRHSKVSGWQRSCPQA